MNDEYRMTGSPTNKNIRALIGLIILAAVVGGIVYFVFFRGSDAVIYVDNGGTEPITVLAGGVEKLVVGPGKVDSFSCRAGSLRIVAKRADEVVFDATKTIVAGGQYGKRKYLLNPEATNRYRTVEVQYGGANAEFPIIPDQAGANEITDPREQKLRLAVKMLKLVPATDWVDIGPDFVLESAPPMVKATDSRRRVVLKRVPKAEADSIQSMLANWDKTSDAELNAQEQQIRVREYYQVTEAAKRIYEATRSR